MPDLESVEATAADDSQPKELTPLEQAEMGTSVDAYKKAVAAEKANPVSPEPKVTKEAATAAPVEKENRRTREEKERERHAETIRQAVDTATAELRAEIARLKQPAETVSRPAAHTTEEVPDDIERFTKMSGWPTEDDFQKAGKTWDQLNIARTVFIQRTLASEHAAQLSERSQMEAYQRQQGERAAGAQKRLLADPEIAKTFQTWTDTKIFPVDSPISPEVLALRPRSVLGKDEQPSALNDIADELLDSEHTALLAKHLSKNGNAELRRLAALPNRRAVVRELALIEKDLTTPKVAKTKTSAGEPVESLTSARATDPLDPEEAAERSGNQTAYNRAYLDKQLRKRGLLK